MEDDEKIIEYFERNDSELVPYVKLIRAAMPEMTDIYEIEELANYIWARPSDLKRRSIPELYNMMNYDANLDIESISNGSLNPVGNIEVDEEKSDSAVSRRVAEYRASLAHSLTELLTDEDTFHGIKADESALKRIRLMNSTAEKLCSLNSELKITETAKADEGSRNAILCIDMPNKTGFMNKNQLKLLGIMMNTADDFFVAYNKTLRFSFGIRDVWKEFEN